MTTSKQSQIQPNSHHDAVLAALCNYIGHEGLAKRLEAEAAARSMTDEELNTALEEVLEMHSDNDVEGAAIGVAAVGLTYPDHDSDEYLDACVRVMDLRCPLLRFDSLSLPLAWLLEQDEMIGMIHDGAERLQAGFALAV
jgi:hypothetical protein